MHAGEWNPFEPFLLNPFDEFFRQELHLSQNAVIKLLFEFTF